MSKQTQLESSQRIERVSKLINPPRIDDTERSMLESVFGDDQLVYRTLRDLFFGFELNENEKQTILSLAPVKGLLRKIFLPEVKKEIAFGQTYDLWQTQDLKTANIESFEVLYGAKEALLNMLETSLTRLDDPNKEGVSLSMEKSLSFLLARNGYISYVDSQIRFLMQFVNQKNLSDQELMEIIKKNSAK